MRSGKAWEEEGGLAPKTTESSLSSGSTSFYMGEKGNPEVRMLSQSDLSLCPLSDSLQSGGSRHLC